MRRDWRRVSMLAALTMAGGLACSGVNGDANNIRDPNGPGIETPDGPGFIQVTVATANPAAGMSYTVTISNGQKQTAGPNATLNFTTIRAGTHEISLSSVPAGCVVAGDNPIVVNVHQSEHVNVEFSITCPGNPS
jgi:hypothetical protein